MKERRVFDGDWVGSEDGNKAFVRRQSGLGRGSGVEMRRSAGAGWIVPSSGNEVKTDRLGASRPEALRGYRVETAELAIIRIVFHTIIRRGAGFKRTGDGNVATESISPVLQ